MWSKENQVVVTEIGDLYTQKIKTAHHELRADEPAAAGGADQGPSPYELLLSALGACTSITLRMYADLKKIPLEKISVQLRHEKIHAVDCKNCETKTGNIDRIERIIELTGSLDEPQRQRLLEIANRCPIHRTLTSEIKIDTQLTL